MRRVFVFAVMFVLLGAVGIVTAQSDCPNPLLKDGDFGMITEEETHFERRPGLSSSSDNIGYTLLEFEVVGEAECEERENWYKVAAFNGQEGFVRESSIEAALPESTSELRIYSPDWHSHMPVQAENDYFAPVEFPVHILFEDIEEFNPEDFNVFFYGTAGGRFSFNDGSLEELTCGEPEVDESSESIYVRCNGEGELNELTYNVEEGTLDVSIKLSWLGWHPNTWNDLERLVFAHRVEKENLLPLTPEATPEP